MSDFQIPRVRFREALTTWLEQRPRTTDEGNVLHDTRILALGSPAGPHGEIDCWVYRTRLAPLEMCFAFYDNFTPDDLICKILPIGRITRDGEGATIQFNGDNCIRDAENGDVALCHEGHITVRHGIKRADLVEVIATHAAEGLARLGGTDTLAAWPLLIGFTSDLSMLLDRLFAYAYCIEQAKRFLRDDAEGLMPELEN